MYLFEGSEFNDWWCVVSSVTILICIYYEDVYFYYN